MREHLAPLGIVLAIIVFVAFALMHDGSALAPVDPTPTVTPIVTVAPTVTHTPHINIVCESWDEWSACNTCPGWLGTSSDPYALAGRELARGLGAPIPASCLPIRHTR